MEKADVRTTKTAPETEHARSTAKSDPGYRHRPAIITQSAPSAPDCPSGLGQGAINTSFLDRTA